MDTNQKEKILVSPNLEGQNLKGGDFVQSSGNKAGIETTNTKIPTSPDISFKNREDTSNPTIATRENKPSSQEKIPETISIHPEYLKASESIRGEVDKLGTEQDKEKVKLNNPEISAPKAGEIGMDLNIARGGNFSASNNLTQVLKHISGYQAAGYLTTGDSNFPAQVQNLANNGDPNQSDTWQASLILKILTVFFNFFK